MKRILLLVSLAMMSQQQLPAQCTLANPGVKLNYAISNGASCQINIDLYFDMIHNPGGKFVWVHIWPAGTYANWNYADPPTLANGGLTGSIATFGLEHQQGSLVVQQAYPPDVLAPGFQYLGLQASEGPGILAGSERYTIRNITLTVNGGCDIPRSFLADVWQSQSAQAQNVHCFSKALPFYANDPAAVGFINCVAPRTFSFVVNTISNASMDVTYKAYLDDGDGLFNPVLDNIEILNGSTNLNAGNNYRFVSGIQSYTPYSFQKPWADRDIWLQITSPAAPNAIYAHLSNSCVPLPVTLGNFRATRSKEWVQLHWTTIAEYQNKGFYIQRLMDGVWKNVGFVPAGTSSGNSDQPQEYDYADWNTLSVPSTYRLKQIDWNGKTEYSEIRLVVGLEKTDPLVVYPNPTPTGSWTIMMEDQEGDWQVSLWDMQGKLLQQWVSQGTLHLTVSYPKSGVYLLRVQEKTSGRMMSRKLVIGR